MQKYLDYGLLTPIITYYSPSCCVSELLRNYAESTLVDMVQLLFIQLPSFNEDEYTVDDTASIIDQVGDLLRGYSYNMKNENKMSIIVCAMVL